MNILIVSPGVYPVPAINGGAVENLIEVLLKSDKITQKHNISIYTVYDNDAKKMGKNIQCNFKYIKTKTIIYQTLRIIKHIKNHFLKKYTGNQYISKVCKEIKKNKENYDIIIVENEPQYGLILNKVKQNAKLILHLHNDYLNENIVNARKMYNVYDEIWTISKFIGDRVNKLGENFNKVKILYNGIDTQKLNVNNAEIEENRKIYNLEKDDFIFMYAGRLAKEKGIEEVIKAFNNIENEKAKLVIIGGKQPGQEKFYKDVLKKIQHNEKIIYIGYVDYASIAKVYSIADVGVVPSICNEAFGLTSIEFMFLGKPLIISDQGALQEVAGINARVAIYDKNYIENLKKEMNYFLELREDKMNKMKVQSKIRANKYTKEVYVENFLTLVEKVKNEDK